nr:Dabb family protein [uncultured Flavobacterium sp.]
MKKLLLTLLMMMAAYSTANAQQNQPQKVLRHVVLFGWQEGTDAAYINTIVTAFSNLPKKIAVVKAFEWGTNNSPENLNKGLTHCFMLTFNTEADRDAYLIHPDHKAFTTLLNASLDKVTVFDYWTNQ